MPLASISNSNPITIPTPTVATPTLSLVADPILRSVADHAREVDATALPVIHTPKGGTTPCAAKDNEDDEYAGTEDLGWVDCNEILPDFIKTGFSDWDMEAVADGTVTIQLSEDPNNTISVIDSHFVDQGFMGRATNAAKDSAIEVLARKVAATDAEKTAAIKDKDARIIALTKTKETEIAGLKNTLALTQSSSASLATKVAEKDSHITVLTKAKDDEIATLRHALAQAQTKEKGFEEALAKSRTQEKQLSETVSSYQNEPAYWTEARINERIAKAVPILKARILAATPAPAQTVSTATTAALQLLTSSAVATLDPLPSLINPQNYFSPVQLGFPLQSFSEETPISNTIKTLLAWNGSDEISSFIKTKINASISTQSQIFGWELAAKFTSPDEFLPIIQGLTHRMLLMNTRLVQRVEWILNIFSSNKIPFNQELAMKFLATDIKFLDDLDSLSKECETKVSEMLEKYPQKFNAYRDLQKKGVAWPHSKELRADLEKAGWIFSPMMIKRDRCFCSCCRVEMSGWRSWNKASDFHNKSVHEQAAKAAAVVSAAAATVTTAAAATVTTATVASTAVPVSSVAPTNVPVPTVVAAS